MTQEEGKGLREMLEEHGGFFFRFVTFAEIEEALETMFSTGASVIVAAMAKPCGKRSCKRIMEKAETREEALTQLSELKNEENWGELSFLDVDFENGSGKAVVRNSFEARERRSTSPGCHFFKNFLEGFLSELFARKVRVTEEKCAGRGDEHCEFKIQERI